MVDEALRNKLLEHPIAYFCAEFALSDLLPIYSGGLGILAGDVVREANDQKLPFVAVGLFYKQGYFRQTIEYSGQVEHFDTIDPAAAGLTLIRKVDGIPLTVDIPLPKAILYAQIWMYSVGDSFVFLLDTDIEHNNAEYRTITQGLYRGNRILQEIVLGIGGERALYTMGIHPSVYHLNEGHSAFAIFEIAHHYMKEQHLSFNDAFAKAKHKIFFTNHTLVPAGNDVFEKEILRSYFTPYANHLNLPIEEMLKKGELPDNPEKFGMTILAMNMADKINAVSTIHSVAAKKLWPGYALVPITNGVHLPTWVADNIKQATKTCQLPALDTLADEKLWQLHQANKQRLVDTVRNATGVILDPAVATLVWARRFASYKQPELLFAEIETVKRLTTMAHGSLQVVIAGKAHPEDATGKAIIAGILGKIEQHKLGKWVVFLPNYSMILAQVLVQGADVWLNTPIRGEEASGTSGMKAGANGALVCSTSDGWVDEVDWTNTGWILDDSTTAQSLYKTLENDILPTFYTINQTRFSDRWLKRMKETMAIVWRRYAATHMLNKYIKTFYAPSLTITEEDRHIHVME